MIEQIIQELPEKRNRFVKQFQLKDKGIAAAVYPTPVHYERDGAWEAIDNRLELKTENGESVYQNKASAVKVSFAEDAGLHDMVTIEREGARILWNFRNRRKERTFPLEGVKFRVLSESKVDIQEKAYSARLQTGDRTQDEIIQEKTGVPNLTSAGIYEDAFPDIDIQYTIQGERIKEDIILKTRTATGTPITLEVKHPGLVLRKEENGNLSLFHAEDEEQEKLVYEFIKPYMYDADGKKCYDVTFYVESLESGSHISVIPDKDWLLAEERVYPVVIDPMTETSKTRSNIEDTYIFSGGNDPTEDPGKVHAYGSFVVGKSNGMGMSRALLRFKNLPDIGKGSIIYGATMYIWQYQYSTYGISKLPMLANAVTSNWSETTARWSNQPAISGEVLDYKEVGQVLNGNTITITPISFDVTKLVREWYNTGQNYGVMVRSKYESDSTLANKAYARFYSSDHPQMSSEQYPSGIFYYRNVSGLEDYQSYHDQPSGRAGSGHTNDYTGNVVWIHPDAETEGGSLQASIRHVYNSSEAGTASRMGYGWRLSCMEELKTTGITDYPYVYIDEDGTKHYFYKDKEDGNKLKDEDGLGLVITATTGPDSNHARAMETKDKLKYTFGGDGYLRFIEDLDGNKCSYAYQSNSSGNYCTHGTDATGGQITLTYTNDATLSRLTAITDTAGRKTQYGYDGQGNLTTITYPDGNQSRFAYDSAHKLLSVTDIDGSQVAYQYTVDFTVPRVSRVTEKGTGGQLGQELKISYQNGNTTIFEESGLDGNIGQTADNKKTTYHFDNTGRPTDILDSDGYANNYAYYTSGMKNHKLSKEGAVQKTVMNLLNNGTFDSAHRSGDGWFVYQIPDGTKTTPAYDIGYSGMSSVKLTKENSPSAKGICQETELAPGIYTLSAYVKTGVITGTNTATSGAGLMILRKDGTKIQGQRFINYQTDISVDDGWERLALTFTMAAKEKISVFAGISESSGTLWVSGVQLETGNVPNKLNLVNNAGFARLSGNGFANWNYTSGNTPGGAVNDPEKGRCALIRGDISKALNYAQKVTVSGKEGDIYNLSCWVKGAGIPEKDFTVSAAVVYENGTPAKWHHFKCNPNISGWQFVSGTFSTTDENSTTTQKYKEIEVHLAFKNQANEVRYTGVQLVQDDGESFVYDSEGNLINAVSAAEKSAFTYDSKSNITKMGNVDGTSFESAFDTKNHLTTAKNSEGVRYSFTYDDKGNPIGMMADGGKNLSAVTPGRVYYIREKFSGNYLDVRGGGNQSGTMIQLFPFNAGAAQKWKLIDGKDGYVNLEPVCAPGMCLDLKGAATADGTTIQLYKNGDNPAQKWKIKPMAEGSYQLCSKATTDKSGLSNASKSTASSQPVLSYKLADANVHQQWYFEPADEGKISDVPTDGGTFCLRGRQTGQYLDVYRGNPEFGAKITQFYYNGFKHQQFHLKKYDAQYYYLQPLHAPGLAVSAAIRNVSEFEGLAIAYKMKGDPCQLFRFVEAEPGKGTGYRIECKAKHTSLSVLNSEYAPGADIILTSQSGDTVPLNKWWILESCGERIESSMTYTPDGRNVTAVTDARGNVTRTIYDDKNRLPKKTIDANGNEVRYTYDANTDKLVDAAQTVGGEERKVRYTYVKDDLKAIEHNGFTYSYTYDAYGNQKSVSVGEQELERTDYRNNNGLVDSVTYANGEKLVNEYDKEERLVSQHLVKADGTSRRLYTNTYDNYEKLVRHEDHQNGVSYDKEYDLIGRVTAMNSSDGQILRVAYDDKNRVEAVTQKVEKSAVTTSYIYGKAEEQQKPGLFYGLQVDGEKRVSYAYDSLARLRKRTLHLDNGASYDTIYECTPGEKSGTTTTLVSAVKNGTEELSYSYDALGNIRSIWENGRKKCTYEYDELSQLVCENNLWEGKRISYSYDKGGNITSRKEYLYTGECLPSVAKQYPYRYCYEYGKERASTSGQGTDSQESLLKEYTYTYGNTNWKDQLTAYEGQPITYDKLGNPLSYRGMTLTWVKGRELTKVVKGGKTISYGYDSEGIRVGKTVDGVKTSYYLNGDRIVSMKTGTGLTPTHFIYDQDDNLVLMKHNGKDYYYIYNVQGDVIGLVDSAGSQVVSYRYNSWGKLVTVTDTTAEHIGEKNPFRYRGYYFDVETGWYYLNSRYYDPEVCRFVNADVLESLKEAPIAVLNKNLYGYCDNNPIIRKDISGQLWDTVLDIAFIAGDLASIIANPSNALGYAELAADVVGLVLPGVTGGGKIVRLVANSDNVLDAAKCADKVIDYKKVMKSSKQFGTKLHKKYDPIKKAASGEKKLINKSLTKWSSKLRPDAVDRKNRIIYELKPYNRRSFKQALKQTKRYAKILGGRWRIVIDMYRR